jgi:hypothetical protein
LDVHSPVANLSFASPRRRRRRGPRPRSSSRPTRSSSKARRRRRGPRRARLRAATSACSRRWWRSARCARPLACATGTASAAASPFSPPSSGCGTRGLARRGNSLQPRWAGVVAKSARPSPLPPSDVRGQAR